MTARGTMSKLLKEFVDKKVSVITNDGRLIVGTLKGFDNVTNAILEGCEERIFATDEGVERVPLGLYLVRGDNIACVGLINEEEDAAIDLSVVRGEPFKAVKH